MRNYSFPTCLLLYGFSVTALVLALLIYDSRSSYPTPTGRLTQLTGMGPVNQAFAQAAREFQVPSELLKAICYLEGRLSNNGGSPSKDNGYGCMHLIQNTHSDQLGSAASTLGVSTAQLRLDMPTNIRGGAALLRTEALRLSPSHSLPDSLSGWYGALAAYSHASTRATALMYAGAVFTLLSQGFTAQAEDGEIVILLPQPNHPDVLSAAAVEGSSPLPAGCKQDQNVDYPRAVDCLVDAQSYNCNQTPQKAPCTFEDAQRPTDYAIDQIVIHDIEGTAQSSLSVFRNVKTSASAHYIVDSDGTIYQVVREKDIAYHAGNYWYNQHSIGIEHSGMDATGYRWYNASEYLASAQLVAYLLKKYHLPLSHERIVSHGTIPSPSAASLPNHVDPGPYWLWDYYIKLIHDQGVSYPSEAAAPVFMLHPASDRHPLGLQGRESSANFSFFSLYDGPSTASSHVAQADITDVRGNVEPDISYYYLARVVDPVNHSTILYKIWYGVVDHPTLKKRFAHAHQLWLAVPRGGAVRGTGTAIVLHAPYNGQPILIYGQPTSGNSYVLGDAPTGAVFSSAYTVTEDAPPAPTPNDPGTPTGNQDNPGDPSNPGDNGNQFIGASGVVIPSARGRHSAEPGSLWYEINYNHRQAWVPASEVSLLQADSH
ncbi:MAG TPA: N-acetylmuramoyl-L-alanine amidase [Ktedonobacteraceae bacterium]